MLVLATDITKSFGVDLLFSDVNFHIDDKDKIGLVGKNGAGKTTLFKIVTSLCAHDRGKISVKKDVNIGYLAQDLGLDMCNSLYDEVLVSHKEVVNIEKRIKELESLLAKSTDENEILKLSKEYLQRTEEFERSGGYIYQSLIRGTLIGLGFSVDDFQRKISSFSGGQKTKIALAKILLQKPDLILLDEPTNYLDIDSIDWLEDFLRNYDKAFIIISHDRFFLDRTVNKIFEIERGTLNKYDGNYTGFIKKKERNRIVKQREYKKQQEYIKRQQEVIDKLKQFNRAKSIKRAESREKLLSKIERVGRPKEEKKVKLKFKIDSYHENLAINIENLSKSFGENTVLSDINLKVYKGDKIGITGANGAGKSTLIKIINAEIDYDSGEVSVGKKVDIAYFDQEQASLNNERTIIEELIEFCDRDTGYIRNLLGVLKFHQEDIFKKISSLSGGEKSRVIFAKMLLSSANLLLLDEPTNHLDIETKEAFEDALLAYDGTILAISHDRYFLNKVTNKTWVFDDGVEEYLGNYEYYVFKINQEDKKKEANEFIQNLIEDKPKKRIKKNISKHKIQTLKAEIKQIEKDMEQSENRIKEYEYSMSSNNFYSDIDKANEIIKQYNEAKECMERLGEEWVFKSEELHKVGRMKE